VTYALRVLPAASKAMLKLPAADARRVDQAILTLAEDPRPVGSQKLKGGNGERRIRAGDYRIIYEVDDGVLVVVVITIGHRREVYR
jgi:mRNA interferase RelE/StbE